MRIEKGHHRRLTVIILFGVSFWIALVARLVFIQLKSGTIFQNLAEQQQLRTWQLEPRRGILCDRRMIPLTMNLPFYSLAVCPKEVEKQNRLASRLAPLLDMRQSNLARLLRQNGQFVWLARKIDQDIGKEIQSLHLQGITLHEEIFRYYPYGSIGGQAIGYTDLDNCGIEGMELELESLLRGRPGSCLVEMDAARRRHSDVKLPHDPPQDGCNVVLTLDIRCQSIVEEELQLTVERCGAKGAMAVIMIPQTGEILAMANIPECDPNCYDQYERSHRKNRLITDTFEPGSIFKMVTAAATLQEGIVAPGDSIYAENGEFAYAGSILHDWKKFGWVTFRQAIEHSVNIAVAKVALQVGSATFYKYAKLFGFGSKTGIRFPGEVKGVLRNPAEWSKRSLMTLSLGQEVSVTALQVACAYGAVANGGQLMQPMIVKRVLNQWGDEIEEMKPTRVRTVLRAEVAKQLTDFLVGVVDHGTGVKAQVDGIAVAGKTGTAQKAEGGTYSKTRFVASFVGFLPADDPTLVGLVVVDEPQGIHWGGEVAAPTFGRIMKRLIHLPDSPGEDYLFANSNRSINDECATRPTVQQKASDEQPAYLTVLTE